MAMFENFPYTDLHNLNLDWIIKIAKDFLDQYTHIQQLISDGETSLQNLTTEGLQQLQDKADDLETLLQEWYNSHSQDIANQLAQALADLNEWYTLHQNYLDTTFATKTAEFNAAADAKAAETIASIPEDYSDLSNNVDNLNSALNHLKIYSKNDYTIQGYIKTTGVEDAISGFHRSDYISIGQNQVRIKLYGKNINNILALIAFYDSNRNFIGSFSGTDYIYDPSYFDIVTPVGAEYIIISTVDSIVPYVEILPYNGYTLNVGKFIDANGTETTNKDFVYSDYIPVALFQGKTIEMNLDAGTITRTIYFYDNNKNPLWGTQNKTAIIPSNASFARFSGIWKTSGKAVTKTYDIPCRPVSSTEFTIRGYVKGTSGIIDDVPGFHMTDYIEVNPECKNIIAIGSGVSVNALLSIIAFYDKSKNFIGAYTGNRSSGVGSETYKIIIPNNTYFVRLCTEDNYLTNTSAVIYFVNDEKRYMTVGYNRDSANDFDSFIAALKATEKEPRHCIIDVNNGTHDIFNELGGETFINSITNEDTAYTIDQPWLLNVDIIGHGHVLLQYSPSESFAALHYYANGLISVLNIRGNTNIKNIEIDAKYCRYAIHDETGNSIVYDNTYRIYENVIAKMGQAYSAYGNTVGCGIYTGQYAKWDNCKLYNTGTGCAYACHSTPDGHGGILKFIDCIFETANNAPLKLGNWGNASETDVFVDNSYLKNNGGNDYIRLAVESQYTPSANSFMVHVFRTNQITVEIDPDLTSNPYTPDIVQF